MPMFNLAFARATIVAAPIHNSQSRTPITALIGFLIVALPGFGQSTQAAHTLTVTGHAGTAPVLQAGGKSYVSIEDLARLTQGSLSFNTDQIVLTLSAPPADVPAASPPAKQGFSRDFLRSAIEAM